MHANTIRRSKAGQVSNSNYGSYVKNKKIYKFDFTD